MMKVWSIYAFNFMTSHKVLQPELTNNIFMLFSLLVAKIINLEMVMSKTIRMFALFLMKC